MNGRPGSVSAPVNAVCTDSTEGAPVVPGITVAGLNDAVAPVGKPVTESTTGALKLPLIVMILSGNCARPPGSTVWVGFGAATVKPAEFVPVPVSVAVCGEFAALSVTLNVAAYVVAAAAVKVTEITQLAPAASDVPQALVSAKALTFVPPSVTPVIVSVALPVFDSVTGIAAAVLPMSVLGNVTVAGERLATGAGTAVPVALNVVICGEPAALSATLSVAV